MSLVFEVVKVPGTSGKTTPFVSIGRGQLDFNAVACELVGDKGQFNYAQILKAKDGGKTVIAVKFLANHQDDCIRITRKIADGKPIRGMTVRNKKIISDLFGKDGSNDGVVRRSVKKIGDDMLLILD